MESKHLYHLKSLNPQEVRAGGSRIKLTSKEFPVLKDISLSILDIEPKGLREPHWHPNANEFLYCLKGKTWVKILTPEDSHEEMTLQPGECAFIPEGYLHSIENISDERCELLVAFSHENPDDIHLSSSFGVMSPHVIAATLSAKEIDFKKRPAVKPAFFTMRKAAFVPPNNHVNNRYKYDLASIPPEIQNRGGWVKKAQKNLFPQLNKLALYDLMLAQEGIREPHWHPNANELNYLISGKVKITLLSPDDSVETFEMQPGDISFMPKGYFHHIETVGQQAAHLAVFFSHEQPSDIGLSGSVGATSNEVLDSIFNYQGPQFSKIPKYQEDRVVVKG